MFVQLLLAFSSVITSSQHQFQTDSNCCRNKLFLCMIYIWYSLSVRHFLPYYSPINKVSKHQLLSVTMRCFCLRPFRIPFSIFAVRFLHLTLFFLSISSFLSSLLFQFIYSLTILLTSDEVFPNDLL